jgi:hypothetical protein
MEAEISQKANQDSDDVQIPSQYPKNTYPVYMLPFALETLHSRIATRHISWNDARCADLAFAKVALSLRESGPADRAALLLLPTSHL